MFLSNVKYFEKTTRTAEKYSKKIFRKKLPALQRNILKNILKKKKLPALHGANSLLAASTVVPGDVPPAGAFWKVKVNVKEESESYVQAHSRKLKVKVN